MGMSRIESQDRRGRDNLPGPSWQASLADIIRLLESRYHARLHDELPYIEHLIALVLREGEPPPPLRAIAEACRALRLLLEEHTGKEERLLFPLIRQLEIGGGARRPPVAFEPALHAMTQEHEVIAETLARVRLLTDGYEVGPGVCRSVARLYRALKRFDEDLAEHTHIEDEVLFPRALALERACEAGRRR